MTPPFTVQEAATKEASNELSMENYKFRNIYFVMGKLVRINKDMDFEN